METYKTDILSQKALEALIRSIPFYRELREHSSKVLGFLMRHSRFYRAKPGEVVIRRGDFGAKFYFVIKGMLQVFPEYKNEAEKVIGYISPGEMFGELSLIRELERNATLIADTNCKDILLLGTDFSPFGELEDFGRVDLPTKLVFYRWVVKVTLKRLQSLTVDYPNDSLIQRLNDFPAFKGKPETAEELAYLHEEGKYYADMLFVWNRVLEHMDFYPTKVRLPLILEQEL